MISFERRWNSLWWYPPWRCSAASKPPEVLLNPPRSHTGSPGSSSPHACTSKSSQAVPIKAKYLMKSAKAFPSIDGWGCMLMLKADFLKLYSHLVSMNGRWRVSVTCYIEFSKRKRKKSSNRLNMVGRDGRNGAKDASHPGFYQLT